MTAIRPKLELLDRALVERVLDEAFQLLRDPGIRVQAPEVVKLLRSGGAGVVDGVAHIPEALVRRSLESVPREFFLYDRFGAPAVQYGGDAIHFDPGSSCVHVLDRENGRRRLAVTADLVDLVRIAEVLPQFAAQSTAVVCADAPKEIGDLYRLWVVLRYSEKPVVTGAFSVAGLAPMIHLLAAEAGGAPALCAKPRAVFDVCPSPPMNWSEFAAEDLVELARAGIPTEIVSMPLAGAAAPVTLAAAVVQHAAETLAGITIHQQAAPGAPIVWGGAPAIFDMRVGTAPMGAMETAMLNAACTQVGKHLGLPTHGYLLGSDAKALDAQAGMEAGMAAAIGALAGINMISGAGMLDSLACHSAEKLVLDAEAVAYAQRLVAGIEPRSATLAAAAFAQTGLRGDFLRLKETRDLFRLEQYIPSSVIDRAPVTEGATGDLHSRARARIAELATSYSPPELSCEVEAEMARIVTRAAAHHGVVLPQGAAAAF